MFFNEEPKEPAISAMIELQSRVNYGKYGIGDI